MNPKHLTLLPVIIGWLASCSSWSDRAATVQEVGPRGWSEQQPVVVSYENTDSLERKKLSVLIRFRKDFSYDRLDFVVETFTPDSLVWRDTLSLPAGAGSGLIETTSLTYVDAKTPYRSNSVLGRTGEYRFRFTPLMPEEPLHEVVGVGIEVAGEP
jgi:gliding motility-associated lipoprotein GldH